MTGVTDNIERILPVLSGAECLKGWTLVGGTALAIQIGHRESEDLDFMKSYTREGSVGIGGAATALYRLDRTDSLMQPSDISQTGDASRVLPWCHFEPELYPGIEHGSSRIP